MPFKSPSLRGATALEAVFASACLALFFPGLFAVCSRSLQNLRTGRQHTSATFALQQRQEEIRRLKWEQLTDGNYLRDNVLVVASTSTANLASLSETITLNCYPTATSPTVVVRPASGVPAVQSTNVALAGAAMLRVDTLISWKTPVGATASRQFTTVVTRGGITR